jgi:hypothetical protein
MRGFSRYPWYWCGCIYGRGSAKVDIFARRLGFGLEKWKGNLAPDKC